MLTSHWINCKSHAFVLSKSGQTALTRGNELCSSLHKQTHTPSLVHQTKVHFWTQVGRSDFRLSYRDQERLRFIAVESQDIFTTVLQLSLIWLVFHGLHSHRKWVWVRVTVFPQATYKAPGMHLDDTWSWRKRFIPPWRECWRRIIRDQVDLKLLEPITSMSRLYETASEAAVSHLLQGWQLLQ